MAWTKKCISAVLLALICLGILLFLNHYSSLSELRDIASFDPSQYVFTYELQTFQLKSQDRNWTLSSVSEYNSAGELQSEQVFSLDSEGNSYYMNGEERQYVSHYPRKGLSSLADYLSDFRLSEESFDQYGRIVLREGRHPTIPEHCERAQWYYCPNTETDEPDALSVFVRTIRSVSADGTEPVGYGANDEPMLEYNTYEITNFDRYGNETCIWADGKCAVQTDGDGYLEKIIEESEGTYRVIQVDDSGKPLCIAVYHKDSLDLISYVFYQYEILT